MMSTLVKTSVAFLMRKGRREWGGCSATYECRGVSAVGSGVEWGAGRVGSGVEWGAVRGALELS